MCSFKLLGSRFLSQAEHFGHFIRDFDFLLICIRELSFSSLHVRDSMTFTGFLSWIVLVPSLKKFLILSSCWLIRLMTGDMSTRVSFLIASKTFPCSVAQWQMKEPRAGYSCLEWLFLKVVIMCNMLQFVVGQNIPNLNFLPHTLHWYPSTRGLSASLGSGNRWSQVPLQTAKDDKCEVWGVRYSERCYLFI